MGKAGCNRHILQPADGRSNTGAVLKNSKGQPKGVTLNYLKIETSGASRTVTNVDDKLK